jgi:hypothetical protein
MATTTDPHTTDAGDGLRMIPLDAIDVVEGANPPEERDADEFAQLVATVREYGVLPPVVVAPGTGTRPADPRRGPLIEAKENEGDDRSAHEARMT